MCDVGEWGSRVNKRHIICQTLGSSVWRLAFRISWASPAGKFHTQMAVDWNMISKALFWMGQRDGGCVAKAQSALTSAFLKTQVVVWGFLNSLFSAICSLSLHRLSSRAQMKVGRFTPPLKPPMANVCVPLSSLSRAPAQGTCAADNCGS